MVVMAVMLLWKPTFSIAVPFKAAEERYKEEGKIKEQEVGKEEKPSEKRFKN